jgi:hypothetical protein
MRLIGTEIIRTEMDTARVICLAVPTFGTVSYEWHSYRMQHRAPMNRSVFQTAIIGQEVGDARNVLVDQALRYTHSQGWTTSHIFFVDDDCLIPPDALTRLLSHKLPIVSGLYYAKTDTPQPLMLNDSLGGLVQEWEPGALVPVDVHGMGCTLIEMQVFRDLIATGTIETGYFNGRDIYRFFATTRDARLVDERGTPTIYNETEDAYFLKRAKAIGYQPTVDTGTFCWHWDAGRREAAPYEAWRQAQGGQPFVLPGQKVAVPA